MAATQPSVARLVETRMLSRAASSSSARSWPSPLHMNRNVPTASAMTQSAGESPAPRTSSGARPRELHEPHDARALAHAGRRHVVGVDALGVASVTLERAVAGDVVDHTVVG